MKKITFVLILFSICTSIFPQSKEILETSSDKYIFKRVSMNTASPLINDLSTFNNNAGFIKMNGEIELSKTLLKIVIKVKGMPDEVSEIPVIITTIKSGGSIVKTLKINGTVLKDGYNSELSSENNRIILSIGGNTKISKKESATLIWQTKDTFTGSIMTIVYPLIPKE